MSSILRTHFSNCHKNSRKAELGGGRKETVRIQESIREAESGEEKKRGWYDCIERREKFILSQFNRYSMNRQLLWLIVKIIFLISVEDVDIPV